MSMPTKEIDKNLRPITTYRGIQDAILIGLLAVATGFLGSSITAGVMSDRHDEKMAEMRRLNEPQWAYVGDVNDDAIEDVVIRRTGGYDVFIGLADGGYLPLEQQLQNRRAISELNANMYRERIDERIDSLQRSYRSRRE